MKRRVLAIAVAAPWVLWALVRTLGLDARHPLVGAMAFTPYAAASSPLPVLAGLALRRWAAAGVAAAAAAALVLAVAPRAVAGPAPEASGPRLVVMTANLYFGRAGARAVVRLAREHDVDVLALEELTPEELGRLDAAGLGRLLPGRVADARPGASGSALLARRRLRALVPLASSNAQPVADLVVPGAPPVRIQAAHPVPPRNGPDVAAWKRSLRALQGADAKGDVRIVAGDFNATLDNRELRRLLDRGYADAAERAGAGLRATWPARPRRSLPIVIDHVLVDRRVRVRRVTVEDIPGSDHRAVIAELTLPAG